jgi:hypothetical protein
MVGVAAAAALSQNTREPQVARRSKRNLPSPITSYAQATHISLFGEHHPATLSLCCGDASVAENVSEAHLISSTSYSAK